MTTEGVSYAVSTYRMCFEDMKCDKETDKKGFFLIERKIVKRIELLSQL